MQGLSDKAVKTQYAENKFRYNGKELQNKEFSDGTGLEWYFYGMREYDDQIGRFFRIDPLTTKFYQLTPYQYASNNPVTNIDLDGLEGMNVNDVSNPYLRASMRESVQKQVKDYNSNASGAAQVKVIIGPGADVKAKIGNTGLEVGASGPKVSFSTDLGGNKKAELDAASGTAKLGAGQGLSVEVTGKLGHVEVNNDGKLDASVVKSDVSAGKTSTDQNTSGSFFSNLISKDLTLAAHAGIVGLEITANVQKAGAAVLNFIGAMASYVKETAKENFPDSMGGYTDTHKKRQQ